MPKGYSFYNQHRLPVSQETRVKISQSLIGRKLSIEHRAKLSLAQRQSHPQRIIIPSNELYCKYCSLQLSSTDIAREYHCCSFTILKLLRQHNIPIRSGKEAHNTSKYITELSLWTKGNQSFLGKKHTEEWKRQTSLRMSGRKLTEKQIDKMRQRMIGCERGEEFRQKDREAQIKRYQNPSERIKTGQAARRCHEQDPLLRYRQTAKMRESLHDPEVKAKLNEAIKKFWSDPVNHEKASKRSKDMWANKRKREQLVTSFKKHWANSEAAATHRQAMLKGMNIRPNKPESKVLDVLNSFFPNEWKYVGDGNLIIAGLNPDFVNVNGRKQIIEVFGDYWHGEKLADERRTETGRIKVFTEYGYTTLILWEKEINKLTELELSNVIKTKFECEEHSLKEKERVK